MKSGKPWDALLKSPLGRDGYGLERRVRKVNTGRMDLDALRTFVEVMRRGSFAAVARRKNVTPSSISRQIASLEHELGVRFFQRTTRKLAPSEVALRYFEKLEPLIEELESARQLALETDERPRGILRVTAPMTFSQVNLTPLLPEFAERCPELSFELILTDRFVNLVEDRVDVAIRLGKLADSSLVAHRLCKMEYVVCASPAYLQKVAYPREPADLEQLECLRYPIPGRQAVWYFRKSSGEELEVAVRGRVVAANGVALRQCAVAGMGVTLLPRWNVAEELARGALVELFPDYEKTLSEYDVGAWILYPSTSYLPCKTRAFVDFMKEKFRTGPPAEAVLRQPRASKRR